MHGICHSLAPSADSKLETKELYLLEGPWVRLWTPAKWGWGGPFPSPLKQPCSMLGLGAPRSSRVHEPWEH